MTGALTAAVLTHRSEWLFDRAP